ncbi:hypothetical protein ACEWY4_019266 [Coilia grayii]|uniref:Olfactory receptor n=1 Tax=Coilia grayii TaxID=363190 RepID=A0ABD1JFK4_9TELE
MVFHRTSFVANTTHLIYLQRIMNASSFTTFILINYESMEQHKYIYFTIFLLPYILIIILNTCLITVICKDRTLHEPMYIFICNLSFNGIYGSTALLPHIMSKLISQSYKISLANCLTQIYCLHTFAIIELMILAIMGYDRYAAICTPLHYHNKMSPGKVKFFIAVSWLFPFCTFPVLLALTIRLSFCANVIPKTHCSNFDLVKLSCSDTSLNNFVGIFTMCIHLFPQFLVILFSYVQILRICLNASKECQKKALQTCTPHLLAVIIYFFGAIFEVTQVRIKNNQIPYGIAVFMSVYFLIMPPLLNPVIYGASALKIHIYRHIYHQKRRKLSPAS